MNTAKNKMAEQVAEVLGVTESELDVKESGGSLGTVWRETLDSQYKDTLEQVRALATSFIDVAVIDKGVSLVPYRFHDFARVAFALTLNHDDSLEPSDVYDNWKQVKTAVRTEANVMGIQLGYMKKAQKTTKEKHDALDILVAENPSCKAAVKWTKEKPVIALIGQWDAQREKLIKKLTVTNDAFVTWGKYEVKVGAHILPDMKAISGKIDKANKLIEEISGLIPVVVAPE